MLMLCQPFQYIFTELTIIYLFSLTLQKQLPRQTIITISVAPTTTIHAAIQNFSLLFFGIISTRNGSVDGKPPPSQ